MTKVLVTGGCGFIGYHLTKKLVDKGFQVDVVDNLSIGKEAKDVSVLGANFLGCDIRSIDNLPDNNYQYIFHLAALSRIQPSFQNPSLTFSVNTFGTKNVVEYALRNKSKLIFAGSSSRHHNPNLSPYAMSKELAEQWIKMYKTVYGLNAEIIRFYNVYGPGELINSHMAAVLGIWRHCIEKGIPIPIVGDGEQRRDFTHVDDIISGIELISFSDHKHEDAWELGTGKNYSMNEVYEMFKEKFQCKKIYLPEQKGNYRETKRLNDDTLNRLGWIPKKELKDYILSLN
jgi:UDP-glucose 4-epimerase